MVRKETQFFSDTVFQFHKNVAHSETKVTVKHFVKQGKRRTTIYQILKRCKERNSSKFATSGKKPGGKAAEKVAKRVKAVFTRNPNISVRQAANKLKLSKTYVSKIKVQKLGIKARTKKKAPKYVKDQEQRAKKGLRRVYRETRSKILVIDDETYVCLDPNQNNFRQFVHAFI